VTYQETDLIAKIDRFLTDAGIDPTQSSALNGFDQYHAGGAAAVDLLIPSLKLTSQDTVLDVGAGFGGPARQIASLTGARVIGLDITGPYVEAATWLTERCGLSDRVSFQEVDIADFQPDGLADAAITMHVQMNVAAKSAWYAQIAERLVPGGRLAIWEVCRSGNHQPTWPMPWSIDGTDSFLATPDELKADIISAGFETREWEDTTTWVTDWFAALQAGGPPTGPALLDEGFTRVLNYVTALNDGTTVVRRGAFTKSKSR
jgi:cyclopropane fatty-acyl-phospholipid synthase-like methyltransferase